MCGAASRGGGGRSDTALLSHHILTVAVRLLPGTPVPGTRACLGEGIKTSRVFGVAAAKTREDKLCCLDRAMSLEGELCVLAACRLEAAVPGADSRTEMVLVLMNCGENQHVDRVGS